MALHPAGNPNGGRFAPAGTAREQARQKDGKFGVQIKSESTVSLDAPAVPRELARVCGDEVVDRATGRFTERGSMTDEGAQLVGTQAYSIRSWEDEVSARDEDTSGGDATAEPDYLDPRAIKRTPAQWFALNAERIRLRRKH